MQSLQARIDSFHKTRRVKRYQGKSSASVKWPHPPAFKANPNTLAEAGFFFSPSWDDRDSVTCFLCGKELSDWDASDDPFEIHHTKCQSSCAWALVRCGLTEDLDHEGRFVFENKMRLPSNKAMEDARLETFGEDWWPHDGEPGHGATSVKMAQAGFVYTPQTTGDDTVTCVYCNLSLSGWEKEDVPIQEHRGRNSQSGAGCPFFASLSKDTRSKAKGGQQSAHPSPPPSRAKRGKTRSATSTLSSKTRRKTRAARGKSVKGSAPDLRRSPSPRTVSREPDETAIPDPAPHPVAGPPPSSCGAVSLPGPGVLSKPNVPPDVALNDPDAIISLSPAGRPTIGDSRLLTECERTMSLEQWIRQEITFSYERLSTDGRRQIELFKTKAAELRQCIDEL